MAEVVINGVRYVPEGSAPPRIGVGVTVHNRPELLPKFQGAMDKFLPEGAVLVIIDDASEKPVVDATYRFHENAGIARSKNKALELLYDRGVDHFFLFDDDTYPRKEGWWAPYVDSREPHLMYLWGDPVFDDGEVKANLRPYGCMLYVERRVLDAVGGMDPAFGAWGFEHESWSDRIHNAGFTTARYQDVSNSRGLVESLDENGKVASSVPESIRLTANPQIAEDNRYASRFIPFRPESEDVTPVALSVLVPSVHTRFETFAPKIKKELYSQYEALPEDDRARVEILVFTDTKSRMLGDKRNQMVSLAQGEYVVFVDDDDRVAPDYLSSLLAATESGKDVLSFDAEVTVNGGRPKTCTYSTRFEKDTNTGGGYQRRPNHICAVKRTIALRTPFPSKRVGEDSAYADDLYPLLKTEHRIERVLYYYDYADATTETQVIHRAQGVIAQRSQKPVVDIVILSKASDDHLRDMTQHTIDTAIAGAGAAVNVVVIEQVPGIHYKDAITLTNDGKFNYNLFGNLGAQTGSAEWVMLANNDLEFEEGWLKPLLKAGSDCVSPTNPGDPRQKNVVRNEAGFVNGRNFSGWCFMVKRNLWKSIGGFDDEFSFWCADDSVIEQVKEHGVKPMLVPASRVKHLTSKTIGAKTKADNPDDDGEMTWALVRRFEEKYGIKKFEKDRRYLDWKARHPK